MSSNKALAIFHHKRDNKHMKVVEKDKVISGMLQDEMNRCREMLNNLEKSVSELPRGVIFVKCNPIQIPKRSIYREARFSYFAGLFFLRYRLVPLADRI